MSYFLWLVRCRLQQVRLGWEKYWCNRARAYLMKHDLNLQRTQASPPFFPGGCSVAGGDLLSKNGHVYTLQMLLDETLIQDPSEKRAP